MPFISQLCGEYVIGILDDVEQRLPRVDRDAHGAFIRENPAFHRKTRDRRSATGIAITNGCTSESMTMF
ncbi:hypothetical protein [Burkholderia ubonensis]|uniref:hypothetical protein n=1 Tax=Burkholderia ubonensis TaxID=101571 RepID=UPI0018DF973A|nr:hypothetical protein [Burkholderia ubonensis]